MSIKLEPKLECLREIERGIYNQLTGVIEKAVIEAKENLWLDVVEYGNDQHQQVLLALCEKYKLAAKYFEEREKMERDRPLSSTDWHMQFVLNRELAKEPGYSRYSRP